MRGDPVKPSKTSDKTSTGPQSGDHPPSQDLGTSIREWAPVFNGLVPTMLTIITIIFLLFPRLKKLEPPIKRNVDISNAAVVERREYEDLKVANVISVDLHTEGYDADENPLMVQWLTLDPGTWKRLDPPTRWGSLDFNTRTDDVTILVLATPPFEYPDCVVVRIMVLQNKDTADVDPALIYDFVDTPPFDPDDPNNPACPWRVNAPSTPAAA